MLFILGDQSAFLREALPLSFSGLIQCCLQVDLSDDERVIIQAEVTGLVMERVCIYILSGSIREKESCFPHQGVPFCGFTLNTA